MANDKNISGVERRMIHSTIEFREEGDQKFFEGEGIVFDTTTDIGWFTEEVASGAADDVMGDDVRGLYNHKEDIVLGRTKSNTMTLVKDGKAVRYKISYNPNDPDHVRVYEKIKRGDVSGSSFAFDVLNDEWSTKNGKDHRKITKFKALYDMGPVTFPAYEATTAVARSRKEAAEIETKKRSILKYRENQVRILKLEA